MDTFVMQIINAFLSKIVQVRLIKIIKLFNFVFFFSAKNCFSPFTTYNRCGTACPPTCDNPNPICTKQCVAGCFCIDGYVLDAIDSCIPLNKCPSSKWKLKQKTLLNFKK